MQFQSLMTMHRWITISVLAFLSAGCAPYQLYNGKPQAAATLEDSFWCSYGLTTAMMSVNDSKVPFYTDSVTVLPGWQRVSLTTYSKNCSSIDPKNYSTNHSISFSALANHHYSICGRQSCEYGMDPFHCVWIKDDTLGAVVAREGCRIEEGDEKIIESKPSADRCQSIPVTDCKVDADCADAVHVWPACNHYHHPEHDGDFKAVSLCQAYNRHLEALPCISCILNKPCKRPSRVRCDRGKCTSS